MNTQTLRSGRSALLLVSLVVLLALTFAAHALTTLPTTLAGLLVVRAPIMGCLTAREVSSMVGLRISLNMDRQGRIVMDLDPAYGTTVRDGRRRDSLVSTVVRPLTVMDNAFLYDSYVGPYVSRMLVARMNLPC